MMSYAWFEGVWEQMSGDQANGVSLFQSARKRLLTFTALLTFVVALLWVVMTGPPLIADRPLMALLCGMAPFAFLPFPYLVLRTSLDLNFAAHVYLATLYIIVTLTAAAFGGAVSTTSFFLMLIPLLATLLLGIEKGVIWVGVVALSYVLLHVMRASLPAPGFELAGVAPDHWVSVGDVSLWNAVMMTLLTLAASFSVANFRAVAGKSSVLLEEAGKTTRAAVNARAVAEDVSRSRAEFIANVSHELRTPLNAIIGYSELLIETATERGDEAGALDNRRVLDAAAKLRGMVNDILKLSAIDTGRVTLELDDVDVEGLTRDAVAAITPAARAKGNTLTFTTGVRVTRAKTDGAKLDYCLRSLLLHAVAFTQDGAIEVRLSVRESIGGAMFCIEVEDTGIGLDPAAIAVLFEPFAHAEDAKVARFDGPNLGLALCRRLARLLGGDLQAAASSGGGALFTLTAPVDAERFGLSR